MKKRAKTAIINDKFWKGKRVLVTGITGFIGSSLAKRLLLHGAQVVGLVRDEVAKSNYYLTDLAEHIDVVHGSLENYFLIERAINEYEIQIVFHLGAQPIVGVANRSPISTFKTNIEGSWNILEACRGKDHIEAVVVASTDKAYGTHKKLPYKEDYPLQAEFPYDVSKACTDFLTQCYSKTYDLPTVVTRFANVYGPGDVNFSRIVPESIMAALEGRRPIIRSDGKPQRDFLYIDDITELYTLLAQNIKITKGNAFNAGTKKPISILTLVNTILKAAGRSDLKPKIMLKTKIHGEIDKQWLDGAKAKRMIGWEPQFTLNEGIRNAIEWYRERMEQTSFFH